MSARSGCYTVSYIVERPSIMPIAGLMHVAAESQEIALVKCEVLALELWPGGFVQAVYANFEHEGSRHVGDDAAADAA